MPTTLGSPSFHYWDSVDPATFLAHDWENPSRAWATTRALEAARAGDGTLLEVGPGPGVDYARAFREAVLAGALQYSAVEGSGTLHAALAARYPEATWRCEPLLQLGPASADVVYARHVLEHQPALQPALSILLAAARRTVVLTWYRPPGPRAFGETWKGVPCQTYARADVLAGIAEAGFRIVASERVDGDEAWVLERT